MTIKDLAAMTGYSLGTVSRVLNNQPHVSPQARERILQAARESGFRLNQNAQQLKQSKATAMLVIAKGRTNDLFSAIIELFHAKAAQTRFPVIVDSIDENDNEVRRALQLCMEKKPACILFLGGNRQHFLADFQKIHVPCVLLTNSAQGLPFDNLSSAAPDNAQAAFLAVEHLARLGHRKIVVIGGIRHCSDTTELRFAGCKEAFRKWQIPFDEEADYESARFNYAEGYRAAKALVDRGREFTGLFAMSDVMAIGAIRALRDAGRRVPEDVSVIGLDGLTLGNYITPRLSTVVQDPQTLLTTAIELLKLMDETHTAYHPTIPVTLIQKESTREIE